MRLLRFRTQLKLRLKNSPKSLGTLFALITAGGFMETTRITVDEVKQRMDRGEQFAFVDSRNPQAWAESDRNCLALSEFRLTSLSNTSMRYPKTAQ
jgi:hypothetical protein